MGAKVVLLVLCATAVSARHLADVHSYLVQPFEPSSEYVERRVNTETVLERRNINYGSKANLNHHVPNVELPYRYDSGINSHHIPEEHSHRCHEENHEEISENIDNYNKIGYSNDEYKLRTNVYPSDSYTYTTELMKDDSNVYTNVKRDNTYRESEDLTQENLPKETSTVREPDISQFYRHGDTTGQDTHVQVTPKTNKVSGTNLNDPVKTNIELNNQYLPSQSNQNDSTLQKGIFINNTKEIVNERRTEKPKINQPEGTVVKSLQANQTRPITSDRGKAIGRNGTIPKEKNDAEEEIGWVWGTEAGNKEATTEMDGLNDRAAFNGDQCPTGKVKVEGQCVETH